MAKNRQKSSLSVKNNQTDSVKHQIVPFDPLKAYLREIALLPRLSPEQEKELAIQFTKDRDLKKAYQLVSSNLWLVVKIAREYQKIAKNLLDLIQEGNIGLMEAVKNFDPNRGVRLPTYATWWIKAYIVKFILANWRMVKIGTTQSQKKLFFNLSKEKALLEKKGFTATPKLLAARLNVKESEVIEMQQRLGNSEVSVDAPISSEDSSDLHSILGDQRLSAEESLIKRELTEQVNLALKQFSQTLNPKQFLILNSRLLSEDKKTLQDLALELRISMERVRQIENQVKEKLKKYLKKNFENIDFESF